MALNLDFVRVFSSVLTFAQSHCLITESCIVTHHTVLCCANKCKEKKHEQHNKKLIRLINSRPYRADSGSRHGGEILASYL